MSVTVSDPSSAVVYSKSVQSDGKFAHTANKAGEYRMCFHNSEGVSQKTIGLMLSSGGRDYKEMAKSASTQRADDDNDAASDALRSGGGVPSASFERMARSGLIMRLDFWRTCFGCVALRCV